MKNLKVISHNAPNKEQAKEKIKELEKIIGENYSN